ncbi:MAG: hypothetical protein LBQ35_07535 [Spirochaetaceae bacterium]|jgi:hypothetical protein|nr:hypothetical protein [Spirochaetaceae bacterium]
MGPYQRRRPFLLAFTASLALTAVSTEAFITAHQHHDCSGEDCLICLQIETARHLLDGLVRAVAALMGFYALTVRVIVKAPVFLGPAPPTPVSLKVKFNT